MSDCEDTDESCGEEQLAPTREITREWMQEIFTKYMGHEVELGEMKMIPECPYSETLSFISRYMVKVKESPTHGKYLFNVIVKQLPREKFSRYFIRESQFDIREIKFYTVIIPDLRAFVDKRSRIVMDSGINDKWTHSLATHTPLCIYGEYSPTEGICDSQVPPESILVLVDTLVDQTQGNFSKGLTPYEVNSALKSIAFLHGRFLAMKVLDNVSFPKRYPFLFETAVAADSYHLLVERGLPQLVDFLESKPGLKKILEALMTLRPRTKDIISSLLAPKSPIATITHIDFWCNNVAFDDMHGGNKGRATIMNWHMVSYSQPTNDVALLMISSVPTKIRRKHTDILLDTYWKSLNVGSSSMGFHISETLGYTREDLDKDYRRSQLLAVLLCIGSIDVALGDPRTEQRLIDVLEDLYDDGILTDEVIVTTTEADS